MARFAEQNSRAQEARASPVTTIHSWSQQRSSSPTPSEIAAPPSPPSFTRDTALVRAARQMSDLRLYTTSEQPRNDSEQPRNDNDPWSPVPTSPQAQHSSGGVISPPQPEDVSSDDVSYASNSSINFGLSPHDLFNRAYNEGQYHEYEHHDDGNVERGFRFQLDAKSSLDSASDSRSVDDHG